MGLAVLAEVGAVRVDHGGGVVEDAGLFLLVHRQHEDDAQFAGERLEAPDDGSLGDPLGVLVERRVLDLAEVGSVEQLLEAQDLGACAAASRAACSWTWIMDSLSPVQAVWKRAARITLLIGSSALFGVRRA